MANNLFKLAGLADLQKQLRGLASEKSAIKVQRRAATARLLSIVLFSVPGI